MIGKIIYFGTVAISKAMFPITSEQQEKKERHYPTFIKSLFILIFLCGIVTLLYYLFPKLIIRVLYGSQYLSIAPFLVYSGLALSFLSLGNLVLIYGLCTRGLKNPYFLFIFLIIEIIFLYIFKNNLKEYILAFMFSNIIMFIGSFFFLKKENG